MHKTTKTCLLLIAVSSFLFACSDSDAPQEKTTAATTVMEEKMEQPTIEPTTVAMQETAVEVTETAEAEVADVVETAETVMEEVESGVAETVEAITEEVASVAGDKPYQLVDGAISANAVEGWKTYNGGGCGACHGKGGIGAVGPNLAQSVTEKLSKEEFVNIVANGKPGTMMRPHKTNKRVMDNMDNLYAYLVARGDDVLGPGNLIKMPLGK